GCLKGFHGGLYSDGTTKKQPLIWRKERGYHKRPLCRFTIKPLPVKRSDRTTDCHALDARRLFPSENAIACGTKKLHAAVPTRYPPP
ncbi:MAG: hypothetical protein IJ191_02020, partial [Treponema sp.]|nr:hypothetical protein [Treponema sp.]